MQRDGASFTDTWEADDLRLSGESAITGVLNGYSEQAMLEGERLGETETVILQGEDAHARLTAYVVIERESETGGPFDAAIP